MERKSIFLLKGIKGKFLIKIKTLVIILFLIFVTISCCPSKEKHSAQKFKTSSNGQYLESKESSNQQINEDDYHKFPEVNDTYDMRNLDKSCDVQFD